MTSAEDDQESPSSQRREALAEIKKEIPPLFVGVDKGSVGGLELTEQTPALLGDMTMATTLMDIGDSFGHPAHPSVSRSRNSPVEDDDDDDDDVVFIESRQPSSVSAPAIADQRNFRFMSSKNEKPQGNYSVISLSSRDLASQKGNRSETVVIDDEEAIETHGGVEKTSSCFIEWGLPGTKNKTKDLDLSTSSLSRNKTKTGVGPFNPGRMNVAGDMFQNEEFATHHSPGFDDFVNMVLEDVTEFEITPEGRRITKLDQILLNGNNITMLVPGGEGPEILGSPSQLHFPVIRNSQEWILYHQWPYFVSRISSLQPNSNLLNQLKSLVPIAKSLYRRARQLINEKDQLTSFVLPRACLPSLINVLKTHEV
nr:zinc finger MYM-type protein 5 isoform X2 [Saimiri boliviensis boliviensis]